MEVGGRGERSAERMDLASRMGWQWLGGRAAKARRRQIERRKKRERELRSQIQGQI